MLAGTSAGRQADAMTGGALLGLAWRGGVSGDVLRHPGAGPAVALAVDPAAARAGPLQSAALMAHQSAPTQKLSGSEWRVLGTLLPYLLEYKWRVLLALVCLVSAKLANVGVPLVMKEV